MDTIQNYLNSMFAGLKNSPEITRAKEELLTMMEDKYHELRDNGVSENEAVGQVITEFGNLDELADVLGIKKEVTDKQSLMVIEDSTVTQMLNDYKDNYPKYAWGVLSLIVGVGIFLGFVALTEAPLFSLYSQEEMVGIGLMVLVTLAAIGVYVIIMTYGHLKPYESLEKDPFELTMHSKQMVEEKVREQTLKRQSQIGLSVLVMILAVIPIMLTALLDNPMPLYFAGLLLIAFTIILRHIKLLVIYVPLVLLFGWVIYTYGHNAVFGVLIAILMVSLGVFSLIEGHALSQASNILLQKEEYSISRKTNKLSDVVSSIYWLLATAIYLVWSFIGNAWHISWLIWPIAGVLYAGIEILLSYKTETK